MQEQLVPTESDLKSLNRFTLIEMKEEDVFVFSAKFIDENPTSNGRIWSREWQEQAVERKLFDGIPFLTNHENDQTTKIGTVFSAELRDDGIHGKVFVPLDQQGKQSKEAIENGRIRNVSINADGEPKREGDLTRILPSDDMRVYEVSAVGVGGAKNAVITEQSQGGTCESNQPTKEDKADQALREFAVEQLQELRDEFVRLVGFSLGISTIDRETYKTVAESLDPLTLRRFAKDLRESYAKSQQYESHEISVDESAGSIDAIKKSLQNINKVKGV